MQKAHESSSDIVANSFGQPTGCGYLSGVRDIAGLFGGCDEEDPVDLFMSVLKVIQR